MIPGVGGSSRWVHRVGALKLGGYLRGGELESRVSRLLLECPTLRVWPAASVNLDRGFRLALRLFIDCLKE